jgi:hypothetical protein
MIKSDDLSSKLIDIWPPVDSETWSKFRILMRHISALSSVRNAY